MVARRRTWLGPEGAANADRPAGGDRRSGDMTAWDSEFFIPEQTPKASPGPAGRRVTSRHAVRRAIAPGGIIQNSNIPYKFPNIKTICHRLETTPFRPSWIRSPGRMQNTFANECFIDELAAVAKADPVEFRLKYLDLLTPAASRC